jgi:uncharacterized protein (TIGR03437 family)
VGAGSGSISWSVASNPNAGNRTAAITLAGQTYPIIQLGTAAIPLSLNASSLSFTSAWGSVSPPAQTVSITEGSSAFTVSTNVSWITVTPSSGSLPAKLSITTNAAGLDAGNYLGAVTVTSADQQTQTITVALTVTPQLVATPASISLQYSVGGAAPTATLTVGNGTNSSFQVYSVPYWLTLTPNSTTLPVTWHFAPSSNVAAGNYSGTLTIAAGGQTISVPVTLSVAGVPVTITKVVSAADFAPGAVSPGEIVVIGGSGLGPAALSVASPSSAGIYPTSLAGTQVQFSGHAAPILYTSSGQICVIVPYELAGQTSANIQVSYGGGSSAMYAQALAPTAPNLFSTTYSVNGQVSALNANYSVNSSANPAERGSIIVLFATGEGMTSPPGVDGKLVGASLTQPLASVAVTIGGETAQVLYAGGAPGLVEGLLQVNVRIPADLPPGNSTLVSVQIGSAVSPQGATIAIQ